MLNWLKIRKQLQAIEASAEAFVKFQFTISDEEPGNHTDDDWVLGYVFGALTGLLQSMGMEPGEEAKPVLERGFATVYGGAGGPILQVAFSRTRQREFAEAQLIGGSEMIAARLRQRAMERMTPDAFRRAMNQMSG